MFTTVRRLPAFGKCVAVLGLLLFPAAASAQPCVTNVDKTGQIGGTPPVYSEQAIYAGDRTLALDVTGLTPSNQHAIVSAYNGLAWTVESSSGGPSVPLYGAAWVYDTVRHEALLFGGMLRDNIYGTPTNALWAYTRATATSTGWSQHTWTGPTPPVNGGALGAFDPNRGRAIFLTAPLNSGDTTRQTWEWTGTSWERGPDLQLNGAYEDSFVFDSVRNVGFLTGTAGYTNLEVAWQYTPGTPAAAGSWARITITGTPYEARLGKLVYDPMRGRILRCFGRYTSSVTGYTSQIDTWEPVTSTWLHNNLNDWLPSSAARYTDAIAYDTTRDTLVVFGGVRVDQSNGSNHYVELRDTWEQTRNSPAFIVEPSDITVDGGGNVTISPPYLSHGLPTNFQWYFNGAPISGATTPTLSLTRCTHQTAGIYVLQITNGCAAVYSRNVRLTVRPPSNDNWPNAANVLYPVIQGTTLGATVDGSTTCGASNTTPDVWYLYFAPYAGNLIATTCGSDFDTVLSVHPCCSPPTSANVIICDDDVPSTQASTCGLRNSTVTVPVLAYQAVLIRVSGYNGAAGNFYLNTKLVPPNDNCPQAAPVLSGTYTGSSLGATFYSSTSCYPTATWPDIWYVYTAPCSGPLYLDTAGSDFDTVLNVRTACFGSEIVCNDDANQSVLWSAVSLPVVAGRSYWIRISGYAGATGSVQLNVVPPPQPNDDCAGATPIPIGDTNFDTGCANTSSLRLPIPCGAAGGGTPFYDLWYSYTAQLPGRVQFRLCNTSMNAMLAIYADTCPTLPEDAIACNAAENSCGSTPLAELDTQPGQRLLIRVGGFNGLSGQVSGTGTLNLTLLPFTNGACCFPLSCLSLDAVTCAATGATYQGDGSVCSPSPCTAGACCLGTHCSVLSPNDCTIGGGAFRGTGSACADTTGNPVTCCRANFNQTNGLEVQDIFDFLTAWFALDPRADFNGIDSINAQDIFDFLAAWFTGC